jgi:hypothetical protein
VSVLAEVVDLSVVRGAHARAIPVEEYVQPLTLDEIDAEVEAIRAELVRPLQRLARLRAAGAHVTAFGPGIAWHDAVDRWFGGFQSLRLTGSEEARVEREALVHSIRATGATTRAIRERLGVSSYAVNEALRKHDPSPERIEGADGRSRSSRMGRAAPVEVLDAPEGARWQQAAEWVRRSAGGLLPGRPAGGLTLGDLARLAGWSEGAASGALNRAMRHGAVVRADGKRGTVREHFPAEVAP